MTIMNTTNSKPLSSGGGRSEKTADGAICDLTRDRSSERRPSEKKDVSDLPLPPRFALAFLGHWFPKKEKAEAKALVVSHEGSSYGAVKSSKADEEKCVGDRWTSVNDDSSSLITYDGNMNICEENTSLCKRLKGYTCFEVMGLLFLLFACSTLMYDIEAYFRAYWGVQEYALHFVTYTTFITQVMAVPHWCLYEKVKYGRAGRNRRSASIISRAYVARRIDFIRQQRSDALWVLSWWPFLLILAWPFMTGCFRILYDYQFRICKIETVHGELGHWNSFLGLIIYGCFCYIIYLERRSFEIETYQIYRYALEQAPSRNVDAVLNRIRVFNKQYKILRKQMRRWMAFTIVVSTWGLTSHITWNYLVFSMKNINPGVIKTIHFLNALVTMQKVTFFIVPYFALGGLNLDHIWRRFKSDITHCTEYKYKEYWKAVNKYLKDISNTFTGDLTTSLISSGVGLYLGLNLTKSQDIGFWIDPTAVGCNLTDLTGI